MFLPRKRITSLTLATFIIITFYYLSPFSSFSSQDDQLVSTPGLKQKPTNERLTPPETDNEVPIGLPDSGSDRFNPTIAEDDGSAVAPSATSVASAASSSKLSSEIITDKRPPPPPPPPPPSTNTTISPEETVVPHVKTQKGPYIFGQRKFVEKHPVDQFKHLPKGKAKQLPSLQWAGQPETPSDRKKRIARLDAVKESFAHSWAGYKIHAWKKDEVRPVNGGSKTTFGGWAASLVDTLDTLWIMGMRQEFKEAIDAIKDIDFTTSTEETLNIFETTIRYLGGLLGAYDLSYGHGNYTILLEKAVEVGDFLYCAFDTPNRMPVTRWSWEKALDGGDQFAGSGTLIAEIGSLTLEFTRLSQLTGDVKYYDAVTRIMEEFEKNQETTKLPGLWPVIMNAKMIAFHDNGFSLGGMADSLYEYLPKQHMLLGGREGMYEEMYKSAFTASMNHIFFQPMLPDNSQVLFPGSASVQENGAVQIKADAQHLGCYAGGMVGIAAKLFSRPEQLDIARKLVDGCIWAYEHMPTGIMPEYFQMTACKANSDCTWDEKIYADTVLTLYKFQNADTKFNIPEDATDQQKADIIVKEDRLKPGFTEIQDRRYILRPEAIESVFIHYRLTGSPDLQEKAWRMFQSIEKATRTEIANSAIQDVTLEKDSDGPDNKADSMESFWMAETLKYFYLTFSELNVVSLDEYVL